MVGVLNAYRFEDPAPQYQQDYGPMCMGFLKRALPRQSLTMYEIAVGQWPDSVEDCAAWIITGSPRAAYDPDPWIQRLGEFIGQAHASRRKMIGICFGHQMIAHFLGGSTEKAAAGWGVGVRRFKMLSHKPWMRPPLDQVSLLFSHQDQVVELPKGAERLAEDPFCPNQMFSMGSHIFCLQGHPEFTPQFAKSRLETRKELVGAEKYAAALRTINQPTDAGIVGQWFERFIS